MVLLESPAQFHVAMLSRVERPMDSRASLLPPIMWTELISLINEEQIIPLKVINEKRTESGHGSNRRPIVTWPGFVSSEVIFLIVFVLALSWDFGDPENDFGVRRYAHLVFFFANASMMTISCFFSKRLHLRVIYHVVYFLLGVTVAMIFLYGGWFSKDCGGWGARLNCTFTSTHFEFTIPNSIAIFSLSVSASLTAILHGDCRTCAEVARACENVEKVSLGMTWVAISMGLAQVNANLVLQVMHTVLAQNGANFIPFLLQYIAASLSKSERKCTADDDV